MSPDAPHDPLIGFVLEGRYRLLDVLGRGGMGNVYVAEDTRLGRRYALKVLKPELARERGYVERFLREAQTIARLQHPNIVDIHSYGEDPSGLVFFTMELLSGEDLESRVNARGSRPYTVQDACRWAIEVARAVVVVHEHGLIHRDLKTQNVFLARRREGGEVVKLLDFGIARAEEGSELTRTGATLGTPSYMSPEQLCNQSVDRRSDIYSFGVLLFKLLTGQLPFRGGAIQVVTQHLNAPPPLPSNVAPDAAIPPELDELVLKTLSKRAADRPATMEEVERALAAVLSQSSALPPSRLSSLRPPPSDTEERAALALTLPASPEVAPPSASRTPADDDKDDDITAKVAASSGSTAPALVIKPQGQDGALERPRGRLQYRVAFALSLACVASVAIWLVARGGGETLATVSAVTIPEAPTRREAAPETKQAAETKRETAALETEPAREAKVQPPPSQELQPATARPPEVSTSPDRSAEPTAAAAHAVEPAKETQAMKRKPARESKKPDAPASLPPKPRPEPTVAPDPLDKIQTDARKCRADLHAVGEPSVVVRYTVLSDGSVGNVSTASDTPLGKCLAGAVKAAKFPPGIRVGQTLSL